MNYLIRCILVVVLILLFHKSCNRIIEINRIKDSIQNKDNSCLKTALFNILSYEGIRSTAYTCPAGIKTQGVGMKPSLKDTLTFEEIKKEFLIEFIKVSKKVKKKNPNLNDCQLYALTSFYFNVTPSKDSKLEIALKENRLEDVKELLGEYVYHRNPTNPKGPKIKSKGLINRRRSEQLIFSEVKLDSITKIAIEKIKKDLIAIKKSN